MALAVSDTELAWLAGLLEGEGSFWMSTNRVGGKIYRYPLIAVNMTDRDVIERVANLFQVKVYEGKRTYGTQRKPWFKATCTGSKAAEFMRMLHPHMGERRQEKIEEVLAEYDVRKVSRSDTMKAVAAEKTRDSRGCFVAS